MLPYLIEFEIDGEKNECLVVDVTEQGARKSIEKCIFWSNCYQ